MSEITELQDRLQSALQRIDAALANRRAPPDNTAMLDALKEKLEEERVLTAQLQERIRALHEKEESLIRAHAEEVTSLRAAVEDAQRIASDSVSMRDEIDAILADLRPQLEDHAHA
jgi:DNA repair exonuclease SbcCD ATPase subunit